MARIHTSSKFGKLGRSALPLEYGGTFAKTQTQALDKLNAVPYSSLGATSGLAKSNGDAKISGSYIRPELINPVTLSGPSEVQRGSQTDFEITNFDSYTTYTVTVSSGAVALVDNCVRFSAPNSAQTVTITVNTNVFTVYVLESKPAQPAVIVPVANATGQAMSLKIISSAFSMTSGVDSHQSTDWQLSLNNTFTSLVTSSTADGANLTTWDVSNLAANTKFYVRVRYKGLVYGYGNWSAVSAFTTA